jgi:hypothetical protein
MLWDLAEGKRLYSLDAGDIIHALVFSPNRYWLCAATQVRPARRYGTPQLPHAPSDPLPPHPTAPCRSRAYSFRNPPQRW